MKEYWGNLTTGQKAKYIGFGILGILVLLFAIFNWQSTELHFVFLKINIPLTLLILICMLGGYAFSALMDYKKFRVKDKEIEALKKEIADLKSPEKIEE